MQSKVGQPISLQKAHHVLIRGKCRLHQGIISCCGENSYT
mgnify:CR=1 FL=1